MGRVWSKRTCAHDDRHGGNVQRCVWKGCEQWYCVKCWPNGHPHTRAQQASLDHKIRLDAERLAKADKS